MTFVLKCFSNHDDAQTHKRTLRIAIKSMFLRVKKFETETEDQFCLREKSTLVIVLVDSMGVSKVIDNKQHANTSKTTTRFDQTTPTFFYFGCRSTSD